MSGALNSVFGGGSALNRERPRHSMDFDIEHASAEAVRQSFATEVGLTQAIRLMFVVRSSELASAIPMIGVSPAPAD